MNAAFIHQMTLTKWVVMIPAAGTTAADGNYIDAGFFPNEQLAERFCNDRGYSVFGRCYIQFEAR